MEMRQLGTSDLTFTRIGLGTWAMGGGDNPYGWGPQDDDESIETIHRALDLGINWIDTAKGYGHGHSEEIVGRALRGHRDRAYIATKCGILWKEDGSDIYGHLKAASIKAECESSLARLQTDRIDLYQIHWPLPDEDIEEGWGAIADLIREGKVRYGGVSNFSVDQMKRVQSIHPITSLQPPYSMLNRGVEEGVLGYCAQNGMGVIVYSPMQAGLLTGGFSMERAAALPKDDWRHGDPLFNEPKLAPALRLVDSLRTIAADNGCSVGNLAVAWVLRRPEVTGAIAGARRPSQADENARAASVIISPEDWSKVDSLLAEYEQQAVTS